MDSRLARGPHAGQPRSPSAPGNVEAGTHFFALVVSGTRASAQTQPLANRIGFARNHFRKEDDLWPRLEFGPTRNGMALDHIVVTVKRLRGGKRCEHALCDVAGY
jgi:hypothetical protein